MRKDLFYVLLTVLLAVVPARLLAWTTPFPVSGTDIDCSVPKVARGTSGATHYAYRSKTGNWHVLYTYRSATGKWGPLETISSVNWAERPDVIEDSTGNPHVFYTGSVVGQVRTDLYWAVKNGGSWTITKLADNPDVNEDYPRAAMDSTGKIHLVYFKGSSSDTGSVIYRTYSGGSWSGETAIGSVRTKVYYHRSDISIDPSNNVHVVWADNEDTLVYRKLTGSSWDSQVIIGTTPHYFSYAKIAAPTANNVVVVTFDQESDSQFKIKWTASTNGGTSWNAMQVLDDGHYPSMDTYNGTAYLVYMNKPDRTGTAYRTWNGTWSGKTVLNSNVKWQGWADVACATDGVVHVMYDEETRVTYTCSANTDSSSTDPVTGVTATPSNAQVTLSWTNPVNVDYETTIIRCKTTGYPTSPTDGTLVNQSSTNPGGRASIVHAGLTNGTTYYYAIYARDYAGNYSPVAQVAKTPTASPKANLLANASINSFSGPVASGWTSYKVNDPNGSITFGADLSNYVNSPSQGIYGIDSASLPSGGFTSAGIYQVISGLTPGKVYQFVGYLDSFKPDYGSPAPAGQRYLHNFGISPTGNTDPETPVNDGTVGGCKWMNPNQTMWNNAAGSSPYYSGFHWAAASFPAESNSISVWAGLTINNAAAKDLSTVKFNIDNCYLFEWDLPANAGLQNGGFDKNIIDLQDGGDLIPESWVPAGGAIGQAVYNRWDCTAEALKSGSAGFRFRSRRGITNAGLMQRIACLAGYQQTFSAYAKIYLPSGTNVDNAQAYIGIDPYGGGDINSPNIVWTTHPTASTSWTLLSASAVSKASSITVFLKAYNTNAASGNYHNADFDECVYTQGGPVNVRTIIEAKGLADDTPVTVSEGYVTAVFSGFFYIEDTGRTNAIRVESSYAVNLGQNVVVSGEMGTTNGERRIKNVVVTQ